MPLTGSDYLLRLAALSLSMVGFAAIVLTLRRAMGGELSGLHMLLVRLFIENGFAVTVFALFPSALSLTPLASSEIWRLSSAAAGLGFAIYLASLFRRRRRVLAEPLPRPTESISLSQPSQPSPYASTPSAFPSHRTRPHTL